jgi:hypothetical protein
MGQEETQKKGFMGLTALDLQLAILYNIWFWGSIFWMVQAAFFPAYVPPGA